MIIHPEQDGIDHINIYSKGLTWLGRQLSNFADTPFEIDNKGRFRTVEGFWYWTITGNEQMRDMPGWKCKLIGKETVAIRNHPTEEELYQAYAAKLKAHQDIEKALKEEKLPLRHYYVYAGRVIQPKEWQWTAELWNKFK